MTECQTQRLQDQVAECERAFDEWREKRELETTMRLTQTHRLADAKFFWRSGWFAACDAQRAELQEENARLRTYLANAEGPMALLDVLRDAFAGVEFGDGTSGNLYRHAFYLTLEQASALRAALGDSR